MCDRFKFSAKIVILNYSALGGFARRENVAGHWCFWNRYSFRLPLSKRRLHGVPMNLLIIAMVSVQRILKCRFIN